MRRSLIESLCRASGRAGKSNEQQRRDLTSLLALGTQSERLILSGIFANKSPDTLSLLPLAPLHASLAAPQHLSRQHEIDRPEAGARQHAKQAWPLVNPRPQDQPRRIGIYFTEDEHPAKLAVNAHLWMVTHKTWDDVAHM